MTLRAGPLVLQGVRSSETSILRGRAFRYASSGLRSVYGLRRKVATAAAAALAVALGYHVVFGQNGLIAYKQKREETRTLDGQLESLRRENEQLRDHTDRLQGNPDAIEHQAREELHYARPGEVIYTLPTRPDTQKPALAPARP